MNQLPPHAHQALYAKFGLETKDAVVCQLFHNIWEVTFTTRHYILQLIALPRGSEVRIFEMIYTSIKPK